LCKNLCDLNLIERCGEIATDDNEISNGRAVQLLQLKRARFYSLLVINTVFEQSLNLCEYGNSQIIKFQSFKTDSATHLASICADFIAAHKDLKDKLITIVIDTQASLEQGENGIVFRDNVLQESNFNLSSMVFAKTSVLCL
jgi:ribonuclease PH